MINHVKNSNSYQCTYLWSNYSCNMNGVASSKGCFKHLLLGTIFTGKSTLPPPHLPDENCSSRFDAVRLSGGLGGAPIASSPEFCQICSFKMKHTFIAFAYILVTDGPRGACAEKIRFMMSHTKLCLVLGCRFEKENLRLESSWIPRLHSAKLGVTEATV